MSKTESLVKGSFSPRKKKRSLPWSGFVFWTVIAVWMVPVAWLILMSVRPSADILGTFEIIPSRFTFDGYRDFILKEMWYKAYLNSLTYATLNTIFSVILALPAAYAFSRFSSAGDKHLFFKLDPIMPINRANIGLDTKCHANLKTTAIAMRLDIFWIAHRRIFIA